MGKRKHSKDYNDEHCITRKLKKKLERKLKQAKKKRGDSTSSSVSSEHDEMLSDYPELPSDRKGKYRLESLSPASFAGALRVIRESFCQDEYVSRGSEVNKNPVATEELLELCADAALDGVSLVVIDNDTEEVTAVAFNKIQVKASDTSEKPFFEIFAEQRCTQGSSRSLIQFMANVDERCNLFQKYNVDCSLEIMFLATLKEHRYKKLSFYLCKYSVEVAKNYKSAISEMTVDDLGPQYRHIKARQPFLEVPKICQAIWTSIGSQKIGKALDFTVHLTVPLSEFVFNGQTYAERLGEPDAYCEVAAYCL